MQTSHYITIVVAVSLVAFLYFAGNTVPPIKKTKPNEGMPPAGRQGGMPQRKIASFAAILQNAKQQLSVTESESIAKTEKQLAGISDSNQMIPVFKSLADQWEKAQFIKIAAFYKSQIGKLDNSEKELTFAARIFLRLMEDENAPELQSWEAKEAINCLEQAQKMNPDNEEIKLGLATGYIEGTGEPMRGVQILLGIVGEKPDDIPANLLLGKMSIQSGQLDKAIGRLETVLKHEQDNKEALYFLAEAYKGKGENKKAIEMLERCKKAVNDPEFNKKADQEINSLK